MLVLTPDECKLYELYDASCVGAGWEAGSGAVWDLRSNALRPDGWTSADAAGLPILPGLVRYDEVRRARSATPCASPSGARSAATSCRPPTAASDTDDPAYPPMGLRLRLKAGYNISRFPARRG